MWYLTETSKLVVVPAPPSAGLHTNTRHYTIYNFTLCTSIAHVSTQIILSLACKSKSVGISSVAKQRLCSHSISNFLPLSPGAVRQHHRGLRSRPVNRTECRLFGPIRWVGAEGDVCARTWTSKNKRALVCVCENTEHILP